MLVLGVYQTLFNVTSNPTGQDCAKSLHLNYSATTHQPIPCTNVKFIKFRGEMLEIPLEGGRPLFNQFKDKHLRAEIEDAWISHLQDLRFMRRFIDAQQRRQELIKEYDDLQAFLNMMLK